MKKKVLIGILILIILIVAIIAIFIVKKNKTEKPEDVWSQYISYINEQKYEEMYNMLTENSKQNISQEDFIKRNENIYSGIDMANLDIQITNVEEEDKKVGVQNVTPYIIDSLGRKQHPTFINESGLYALVFGSKLPSAKKFKRWVTSEVLPALRKTGQYQVEELSGSELMAKALIEAQSVLAAKDKQIQEMKPKVVFADAVATSHTSILVGELDKILKQNGIEMGQKRLFAWLREKGYLIKRQGTDYNMPTQKAMELGLFEIKEGSYVNGSGVNITTKTPKITGKGQQYFINKFLQ